MKIYLDFDGTVCEHAYPKIGRENFGCFDVIVDLQKAGHEIILNTYRSDCNDGTLNKALEFINYHPKYEIEPILHWTLNKINPPLWNVEKAKLEGVLFIDDIAAGIPLKPNLMIRGNMVDWDAVRSQLLSVGIL